MDNESNNVPNPYVIDLYGDPYPNTHSSGMFDGNEEKVKYVQI
jgi:hypothetical protein